MRPTVVGGAACNSADKGTTHRAFGVTLFCVPVGGDVVDEDWRFVSIGIANHETDVGGVNPWEVEWRRTGRYVSVAHPQYPSERHLMMVYKTEGADPPVLFAAGEFSNGVWGFFVPK